MILTQSKLNELSEEAMAIVELSLGRTIDFDINFIVSNSKRIGGTAYRTKNEIRISKYVMQYHDENKCMNTLIHEILHLLSKDKGHKGDWKRLATMFNNTKYANLYGMIKRTYTPTEEQHESAKYLVTCIKCERKIHRHKFVKIVSNPENFRCKCGGGFKRVR